MAEKTKVHVQYVALRSSVAPYFSDKARQFPMQTERAGVVHGLRLPQSASMGLLNSLSERVGRWGGPSSICPIGLRCVQFGMAASLLTYSFKPILLPGDNSSVDQGNTLCYHLVGACLAGTHKRVRRSPYSRVTGL